MAVPAALPCTRVYSRSSSVLPSGTHEYRVTILGAAALAHRPGALPERLSATQRGPVVGKNNKKKSTARQFTAQNHQCPLTMKGSSQNFMRWRRFCQCKLRFGVGYATHFCSQGCHCCTFFLKVLCIALRPCILDRHVLLVLFRQRFLSKEPRNNIESSLTGVVCKKKCKGPISMHDALCDEKGWQKGYAVQG